MRRLDLAVHRDVDQRPGGQVSQRVLRVGERLPLRRQALEAGVAGVAAVLAAVLASPVPAAALDATGPQADTASPMPRPKRTIPVTGVARVKCPRLILTPYSVPKDLTYSETMHGNVWL